jgi:hypothetical protein
VRSLSCYLADLDTLLDRQSLGNSGAVAEQMVFSLVRVLRSSPTNQFEAHVAFKPQQASSRRKDLKSDRLRSYSVNVANAKACSYPSTLAPPTSMGTLEDRPKWVWPPQFPGLTIAWLRTPQTHNPRGYQCSTPQLPGTMSARSTYGKGWNGQRPTPVFSNFPTHV